MSSPTRIEVAYSCGLLLLLPFHLAHQGFCLVVLAGHDVAHTQVGQHNGRHSQQLIQFALYQGLIELCCLLKSAI